ncbi:hypothetical protein [Burkholderia multivorans]|uniref:hypothetical protein n=1 Tax=Burkholderia multivorans TaxID=87883 RepID=UPI00285877DC|nr:hypothetical protein [Burkholderia multivorans]MDR8873578.1 hypothetical protein [Burkholderia multivorans]MDR8890467.1 hypothetical protein [Burkholderia multivorans]MDR8891758.1 hypothetical protein [Burkholderia multivorans]MDR8898384.1 hypothetical protein [Burkholderia multivorans]MDR8903997.1 hypothetical protein [Burkholderia multivorans]
MDQSWKSEPNEEVFEAHGMKCKIRRVSWSGHLCGYVGVPESHPWFGKDYNADVPATRAQLDREVDIDKIRVINLLCANAPTEEATSIVLLIDVHGGLTYSSSGVDALDGLWVFGFDCAHAGDLCPVSAEKYGDSGYETYRDFAYVKRETESLALQLSKIA